MFIRSERLFLRPGWQEDWNELRSRIPDWTAVRQFLFSAKAGVADLPRRRFPQFVVTLPGDDGARLIGCFGLRSGEHGSEMAYWIAPAYWGQGYATEAGRAVISLARTLGHRRIAAIDFADNTASGRVLAKLGFRATGDSCLRLVPQSGVLAESLVHSRDLGEPSDCNGNEAARFAA